MGKKSKKLKKKYKKLKKRLKKQGGNEMKWIRLSEAPGELMHG